MKNDPLIALEFYLLNIKCGGCYNPPSFEDVRTKAAKSLAKIELPDFSKIDQETVYKSFLEIWDGKLANPTCLVEFQNLVERLSNGATKLRWADPKIFTEPKVNAEHLQLCSNHHGSRIQKLYMRPDLPIEFVD